MKRLWSSSDRSPCESLHGCVAEAEPRSPGDPWLTAALPPLVLGLTYLPLIVIRFGFLDDYTLLAAAIRQPTQIIEHMVGLGRPMGGLLLGITLGAADQIDDLRWIRLISVVGIASFGGLLSTLLRRNGWSRTESIGAAVLICTLPSWQVYASWAVMVIAPWAALAATASAYLLFLALSSEGPVRVASFLGAFALAVVAVLTYHPTAMIFWLVAAIILLRPDVKFRRLLARLVAFAAVFIPALLVGFATFRIGVGLYGVGENRGELVTDPVGKAAWFLSDPLQRSLNIGQLTSSTIVALLVAVTLATGCFLYFRGTVSHRILLVALCGALVPIAYLPNLITAENWASFRSQGALAATVAFLALMAVRGYTSSGRRHRYRRLGSAIIAIVATLSVVSAVDKTLSYFALPQEIELRVLTEQLRELEGADEVLFVRASGYETVAPGFWFDEFGLPSTVAPWTPEPLVFLIGRELDPDAPSPSVTVLPPETDTSEWDYATVDMRAMAFYRAK